MAEYIDRTKIKYPKVDSPKGEYWDRFVTESYINSMPTEDVAPVVHGKWVSITKNNSKFACSVCGRVINLPTYTSLQPKVYFPYCHCGAKMDKE